MAAVINLQTPVGESSTATAMAASSKESYRGAKDLEQRTETQQTSFKCSGTELLREASDRRLLVFSRL